MWMRVALILLGLLALVSVAHADSRPHIIFIMADDYGWANIGYHSANTTETVTPNLDALNSVGIELDRHYVYKFCSPSRCAFLSGRNPIHVNAYNLQRNYNPANNISGYAGVPINMTMIAGKMKEGGYATHFTGKWDAGWATQYHLPVNRGFDTGFGYFQHSNDYWQYTTGCAIDLWNNTEPAWGDANPKYCSQSNQTGCVYEDDMFVNHVLDELEAHDISQPMFYYWAMHSTHVPLEVPQAYLDKFAFIENEQRRNYSATVNHMDDMVGMVVAKLKEKKMWDNTLLVFSADNGGALYVASGANNYPLKGGKMTNWEGGIRVNAFVSGGYVPEKLRGTKSEDFITLWDWYATFSAIAGVDPTDEIAAKADLPPIDSYNMWPLLSGSNSTNPRTEIPLGTVPDHNEGNGNNITVQGIIVPPYKLLLGNVTLSFWQGPMFPNASTVFGKENKQTTQCGDSGCLFDLMADPTEHVDISAQFPSIVAKMQDRVNYYQTTVFNVDRGPMDHGVCAMANSTYHGFFGPWVVPIF